MSGRAGQGRALSESSKASLDYICYKMLRSSKTR